MAARDDRTDDPLSESAEDLFEDAPCGFLTTSCAPTAAGCRCSSARLCGAMPRTSRAAVRVAVFDATERREYERELLGASRRERERRERAELMERTLAAFGDAETRRVPPER